MIRTAFLALFFVAVFTNNGNANNSDCDGAVKGACWNNMSVSERVSLLKGFIAGQLANQNNANFHNRGLGLFFHKDHYELPDNTTYNDVIKYLDKLYSYPVNRDIVFSKAMLLASLYLRDDDTNDRITLLKWFREGKSLPTFGKIKKVLSPNTLLIEGITRDFKVELVQTSLEGLSNERYATAMNLLNTLAGKTGYSKKDACDGENADVTITYPIDFFTSSGNLRAEVEITGDSLCKRSTIIPYEKIGWYGDIKLSNFLLNNGVLKYSKELDPKWPTNATRPLFHKEEVKNNTVFERSSTPTDIVKFITLETGQ